jgi:hypothetical protein
MTFGIVTEIALMRQIAFQSTRNMVATAPAGVDLDLVLSARRVQCLLNARITTNVIVAEDAM